MILYYPVVWGSCYCFFFLTNLRTVGRLWPASLLFSSGLRDQESGVCAYQHVKFSSVIFFHFWGSEEGKSSLATSCFLAPRQVVSPTFHCGQAFRWTDKEETQQHITVIQPVRCKWVHESLPLCSAEDIPIAVLRQREAKWLEMLNSWDKFMLKKHKKVWTVHLPRSPLHFLKDPLTWSLPATWPAGEGALPEGDPSVPAGPSLALPHRGQSEEGAE